MDLKIPAAIAGAGLLHSWFQRFGSRPKKDDVISHPILVIILPVLPASSGHILAEQLKRQAQTPARVTTLLLVTKTSPVSTSAAARECRVSTSGGVAAVIEIVRFLTKHQYMAANTIVLAVRPGAETTQVQANWDDFFTTALSSDSDVLISGISPVFAGWSINGAPRAKEGHGTRVRPPMSERSLFLVPGLAAAELRIWRHILPLAGHDGWLDAHYAAARLHSLGVKLFSFPTSSCPIKNFSWLEPEMRILDQLVQTPAKWIDYSGIDLLQNELSGQAALGIPHCPEQNRLIASRYGREEFDQKLRKFWGNTVPQSQDTSQGGLPGLQEAIATQTPATGRALGPGGAVREFRW